MALHGGCRGRRLVVDHWPCLPAICGRAVRPAASIPQIRGPGRVWGATSAHSPRRPSPDRSTVCGTAATAAVPGIPEEEFVARRGQPQTRARRTAPHNRRRVRDDVNSVLARAVREVEAALLSGRVTPLTRTKFQAVALLLRDERARVREAENANDTHRAEQLKRLDGIATILAKSAVRDAGLLALLAEDAVVSDEARSLKRDMLRTAGIESGPHEPPPVEPPATASEHRVVPRSVVSRQLANPF